MRIKDEKSNSTQWSVFVEHLKPLSGLPFHFKSWTDFGHLFHIHQHPGYPFTVVPLLGNPSWHYSTCNLSFTFYDGKLIWSYSLVFYILGFISLITDNRVAIHDTGNGKSGNIDFVSWLILRYHNFSDIPLTFCWYIIR